MELLFNIAVFAVFLVLWAAFAYALVTNQAGLDDAWKWLGSLPFPIQVVVAVLTLPVYLGLWVWESGWPLIVRLIVVLSLGAWNLWMFLPRALAR
jgi:hypothetical protein